mmetsp:Transcript_7351/g.10969  ORF Transcript_7351/g.10969 Transcript_7351/m.10969 type:complete len:130 (-) Transcript_7351:77-466(-)
MKLICTLVVLLNYLLVAIGQDLVYFRDLCLDEATDCFADATCKDCVSLGDQILDSSLAITCDDAMGMFKNAYNGSMSIDPLLECEPYNEMSFLGIYLSCVWDATPCSSPALFVARLAALISASIGAYLL